MVNEPVVKNYVNNFRRYLSHYLRPGLGIRCTVYRAKTEGAILEFSLGKDVKNKDEFFVAQPTLNHFVKKVNPHIFGGNIENVKFSGTNISLDGNKIIIIKGEDDAKEWNETSAKKDIERILSHGRGR